MKRCLLSLLKGMQIKSTRKSQPTPTVRTITEKTSLGMPVEKSKPSCTVLENMNWCSQCGNSMEVLPKFKNSTTYNPVILLLGIYLKKIKVVIQKLICSPISLQDYLQKPRYGYNLKYPPVDKWIKKLCVCVCVC